MRARIAPTFLLPLATVATLATLANVATAQTTGTTTTTTGPIVVTLNRIETPDGLHDRDTTEEVNHGLNVYDCAARETTNLVIRLQGSATTGQLFGRQFDVWQASSSSACQTATNRTLNAGACKWLGHFTAAGTDAPEISTPLSTFVGVVGDTNDTTRSTKCDPNAAPGSSALTTVGAWILQTDQTEDRGSNVTNYGFVNLPMDFARPFAVTPKNTNLTGDTKVPLSWSATTADSDQVVMLVYASVGGCGQNIGTGTGTDAGVDAGVDASTDASTDADLDASTDADLDASTDAAVDGGVDGGTGGPVSLVPGGYLPTTYNTAPEGWELVDSSAQGATSMTINLEALGLSPGAPAADGGTASGANAATVVLVPQDQAFNTGAISTPICVQRVPTVGLCELLEAEGKSCPSGACAATRLDDHRGGTWLAFLLLPLAALLRRLRRTT